MREKSTRVDFHPELKSRNFYCVCLSVFNRCVRKAKTRVDSLTSGWVSTQPVEKMKILKVFARENLNPGRFRLAFGLNAGWNLHPGRDFHVNANLFLPGVSCKYWRKRKGRTGKSKMNQSKIKRILEGWKGLGPCLIFYVIFCYMRGS